jgi:hypothetical protein
LIEDSNKTPNAIWKSKEKQKIKDSNCVEVKSRKPIKANWENSKVLTLINMKKTKHETN